MLVSAQVWQPTVLTTEFTGPLTIAEPGQPVTIQANWRHAKTKVHGLPTSPESASIAVEQLVVDRATGESLFKADRLDLNGRLVSGTVQAYPVIEMVLKLVAAAAPSDARVGLDRCDPDRWRCRHRSSAGLHRAPLSWRRVGHRRAAFRSIAAHGLERDPPQLV